MKTSTVANQTACVLNNHQDAKGNENMSEQMENTVATEKNELINAKVNAFKVTGDFDGLYSLMYPIVSKYADKWTIQTQIPKSDFESECLIRLWKAAESYTKNDFLPLAYMYMKQGCVSIVRAAKAQKRTANFVNLDAKVNSADDSLSYAEVIGSNVNVENSILATLEIREVGQALKNYFQDPKRNARYKRVIEMVLAGCSNDEIANEFGYGNYKEDKAARRFKERAIVDFKRYAGIITE